MYRKLTALLLLPLLLLASGCPITPSRARDGVALAYGFIGDMQTKYQTSCSANPSQYECQLINKGVALQRIAATALNDYCSGVPKAGDVSYSSGGPCSEQPGMAPRLQAALKDLNSIMADIKKLKGAK